MGSSPTGRVHNKGSDYMSSKIYSISDDDFIKLVLDSASYSDVLRFFCLRTSSSSNIRHVKDRMSLLNCSFGKKQIGKATYNRKRDLSEILTKNSDYDNTCELKRRLLKSGMLTYVCAVCGNDGIWNGKDLVLVLDHINGDKHDNRIENLILLCPNCDSQTETYKGKNKKKQDNIEKFNICCDCGKKIYKDSIRCRECLSIHNRVCKNRPDKNELNILIHEKSFTEIGNMFNVSSNTIKKWCKKYDLPFRKDDL